MILLYQHCKNIWSYRGFVLGSVRRDFQVRYRNSMFGGVWTVLSPLATIAIYIVIFTKLMNSRIPNADSEYGYAIYICAGMIHWSLFAEIINRTQGVFLENANLIKKLSFPRICLPIIALLNSTINYLISMVIFLCAMIILNMWPNIYWLSVIPILVIQLIFAIGLGVLIGIMNVFFRDVGQLFSIVMQFWFWMTPIIYPVSILPEKIASVMAYNPMAIIIGSYQTVFVQGEMPLFKPLGYVLILAICICVLALLLYRRRVDEMVDEL